MAKEIIINDSRIGLVYEFNTEREAELFNRFLETLSQFKETSINSTISKRILDNSIINEYSIETQLNTEVLLDKVITLKLFKNFSNDTYYKYQVLFTFKSIALTISNDTVQNYLNKALNIFLKELPEYEGKPWSQHINNRDFKQKLYLYEKSQEFIEKKATNILTIPGNSIFDSSNFLENKTNKYCFGKDNFYEIALANLDQSYKYRMIGFCIAIAYKTYFNEQISKISHDSSTMALEMSADEIKIKFNNLVNYANEINIFETAHFFKYPIETDSYQAFKIYKLFNKGLLLDETYTEFKDNLNSLIQTISILEKRINEAEKEQAEEKEKKFTSLVGIITGIIALLTFFADGPSILKNAFDYDSSTISNWIVFGVLGLVGSGLFGWFNSLFPWQKNN